jgi:hypothetical protein
VGAARCALTGSSAPAAGDTPPPDADETHAAVTTRLSLTWRLAAALNGVDEVLDLGDDCHEVNLLARAKLMGVAAWNLGNVAVELVEHHKWQRNHLWTRFLSSSRCAARLFPPPTSLHPHVIIQYIIIFMPRRPCPNASHALIRPPQHEPLGPHARDDQTSAVPHLQPPARQPARHNAAATARVPPARAQRLRPRGAQVMPYTRLTAAASLASNMSTRCL